MNAPEKGRRYMLRAVDKAIVRSGSIEEFRKIAAEVRANIPKPKRGESIVRELHQLRLRGGRF